MPGLVRRGVSRRIKSDEERARLRDVVKQLQIPDKMGVIARTAGEGRSKNDLQGDLDYLLRLWKAISQRASLCARGEARRNGETPGLSLFP